MITWKLNNYQENLIQNFDLNRIQLWNIIIELMITWKLNNYQENLIQNFDLNGIQLWNIMIELMVTWILNKGDQYVVQLCCLDLTWILRGMCS